MQLQEHARKEIRVLILKEFGRQTGRDILGEIEKLKREVEVDLSGADLNEAILSGANFNRADLSGAILSEANLKGARGVTEEHLKEAKSLQGATMPDGSVYP